MEQVWKVGELARQAGVTVRTLHHYEEIGLLSPSSRSPAGYRLYTERDLARLQQVMSLRQLGFPLDQIRSSLDESRLTALEVVELHLARVREQIEEQQALRERLEVLAGHLRSTGKAPAGTLIQTMEAIAMLEKYYTPDQLRQLEERRTALGDERIREVEAEWPRLMAEVQAEMDRGTDPADERVQRLAERWAALVREFTGGDPGIAASLQSMYAQEPSVHGMDTGPMRAMGEYIARAAAAAKPRP